MLLVVGTEKGKNIPVQTLFEKEEFRIRELIYSPPPPHLTLLTTIYVDCVYEPVLVVIEANVQQQGRKRRGNDKGATYFVVMTLYFTSQQILKHFLAVGVIIITHCLTFSLYSK